MTDLPGFKRMTEDMIESKRKRIRNSVKEGRHVEGRLRHKNMIYMKGFLEVKDIFEKVDKNLVDVILPKKEDKLEYDRVKNVFMSGEDYTMEFEVPVHELQEFGNNQIGVNHNGANITLYSLYDNLIEQTGVDYLNYFKHTKGKVEPTWYEMSEQPLELVMKYSFVLPAKKGKIINVNLENLEKEYNLILNTVKKVLHNIDGGAITKPYTHIYSDGSEEEIIWSRKGGNFNILNSRRIQEEPIELISLFNLYKTMHDRYINWIKKTNIENIFKSETNKSNIDTEKLIGNYLSKDDINPQNSIFTDGLTGAPICNDEICSIMGGNKKTKRKPNKRKKNKTVKGKPRKLRKARKLRKPPKSEESEEPSRNT